jgi:hypothetical protein
LEGAEELFFLNARDNIKVFIWEKCYCHTKCIYFTCIYLKHITFTLLSSKKGIGRALGTRLFIQLWFVLACKTGTLIKVYVCLWTN